MSQTLACVAVSMSSKYRMPRPELRDDDDDSLATPRSRCVRLSFPRQRAAAFVSQRACSAPFNVPQASKQRGVTGTVGSVMVALLHCRGQIRSSESHCSLDGQKLCSFVRLHADLRASHLAALAHYRRKHPSRHATRQHLFQPLPCARG
jgi:hypothetical protein